MKEQEFDECIKALKEDVNELYNGPLVHLHRLDPKEGVKPYDTQSKKLLERIAQNIILVEDGIKNYSRPKDWSLIQEGISTTGD